MRKDFRIYYFVLCILLLFKAELFKRIEKYISGECERLPSSARTIFETQPGYQECPFFSKVAACRFRDNCSR